MTLDIMNARAHNSQMAGTTIGWQSEPEQRTFESLAEVVRVPGVRVNHEEFLHQGLYRPRMGDDAIACAVDSSPLPAGVSLTEVDRLAEEMISYETNKSTTTSFVEGIPGGFAMLGTISVDLMQYYMHALRIMQKLTYLYDQRDLLPDGRDADGDMFDVLAVFFGVMLGVGGAVRSLTAFARVAARTAYRSHVTKHAPMSIARYPVVKHSLRLIGISITKSTVAKGFPKIVPVIGGFASSGLTFVALQSQSALLGEYLCETPPPDADVDEWDRHRPGATRQGQIPETATTIKKGLHGKAKAVMVSAKSTASGIADGTLSAAPILFSIGGHLGRRK